MRRTETVPESMQGEAVLDDAGSLATNHAARTGAGGLGAESIDVAGIETPADSHNKTAETTTKDDERMDDGADTVLGTEAGAGAKIQIPEVDDNQNETAASSEETTTETKEDKSETVKVEENAEKNDGETVVAEMGGTKNVVNQIIKDLKADEKLAELMAEITTLVKENRIKRNFLHQLKAVGQEATEIGVHDADGRTALMCAAARGDFRSVQKLIQDGTDINRKDAKDRTAAMFVSHISHLQNRSQLPTDVTVDFPAEVPDGHVACLRLLVQAKADVNFAFYSKDDYEAMCNTTALILAAQPGCVGCVRLLTEEGVDVNAQDFFGYTALGRGATAQSLPVCRLLLDAGATFSVGTLSTQASPLMEALRDYWLEGLQYFLQAGAAFNPTVVENDSCGTFRGSECTHRNLGWTSPTARAFGWLDG